jgi:hypothetical protein
LPVAKSTSDHCKATTSANLSPAARPRITAASSR